MATDNPESDQNDDSTGATPDDALVSRLRVIEDQPLASRADAYASVHEELRTVLEGGDVQRDHG